VALAPAAFVFAFVFELARGAGAVFGDFLECEWERARVRRGEENADDRVIRFAVLISGPIVLSATIAALGCLRVMRFSLAAPFTGEGTISSSPSLSSITVPRNVKSMSSKIDFSEICVPATFE
jgi:hypothetical protein